jgi:O-methyltransferase
MSLRHTIKTHTPWPLHYVYRKLYYAPQDVPAALGFLFHGTKSPTTFGQRLRLIAAFYKISYFVDCPHTEHELIVISRAILNLGPAALGSDGIPAGVPGTIVEAGAFHGGSTAKLSLVARLAGRRFEVFDSFAGMPENTESHGKSIYGREHHFPKGSHAVGLDEVRGNVERYGDASRTRFYKGFFSDTMPGWADTARAAGHAHDAVAAACINVDLVQSTRDCLHYLYPLTSPGGVIYSQDAHFPWIIELFRDEKFWREDVGIAKPEIEGLGQLKFVAIRKE